MKRKESSGSAMRLLMLGFTIGALILGSELRSEATPVQFGNNYYEFVLVVDHNNWGDNSWTSAQNAAASSLYEGMTGHLATISSQQENDFIYSLVAGRFSDWAGAWLGGKHSEGWHVGPDAGPFTYTNWGGVEPNNQGLAYMQIGGTYVGVNPGQWLDSASMGASVPGQDPVIGYFVEYEGPSPSPVPEPATMLLLASGLVGLAGLRRRFRRSDLPC